MTLHAALHRRMKNIKIAGMISTGNAAAKVASDGLLLDFYPLQRHCAGEDRPSAVDPELPA